MSNERAIRREVGTIALMFTGLGSIIGSGWLFGAWRAAQLAGPGAVYAWIIGAVVIMFVAVNYAELGAMLPESGGAVRYGHYSHGALVGFVAVAGIMLLAVKLQMLPLLLFMALAALMMFAFGLMFANFTSLAMEPQGHIAGTASSLYGSITTLLGIGIGTTIGQDYNGTLLPFATGFFLCTLASLAVVLVVEKGRLFKPRAMPVTSGADVKA